jgi:uncharacterized protein (TIGR03663 family)
MEDTLRTDGYRAKVVTVEHAAYGLVAMLATWLRLFHLGLRPLYEGEAFQALAAFRFVHGANQAAPAGAIPALFTGNVAAFALVGASDITARWLPAVAGLALVLLPYWFRHRLGRGGALVASLLLALSPSAVYFSRALDGSILVAACGLSLAVGLVCYVDTRRPRALYVAATALGLGLCAGPAFISLLLIFVLFTLLLIAAARLLRPEIGQASLAVAWWALRSEDRLAAQAGVVLAATFGLAATSFVLHPAGIGHAADLIGAWARGFLREPGGQPVIYPLLLLVRYEPLILLLGLVEGGWAAFRARRERPGRREASQPGSSFPHTPFLLFWAVAGMLLVLLAGHRPPGNVLLVVVPLALLAGQGVQRAWRWLSSPSLRREVFPVAIIAGGALCLATFFYLQMAAYAFADDYSTVAVAGITLYMSTTYLLLALVAVALLIGLGIVVWIWRGGATAVAGGWLAIVVALSLFGLRAMWGLSFSHGTDPRELMIGQGTAPDVRVFVERVEALSLDESGDHHTLSLTVDAGTGPVVAWYLRDFRHLTVVDGLSTPPSTTAAVTLAMQDLPIGETFRGRGFPLRSHWSPWGLWRQTFVRWLLFTEGSQPTVDQEVVLWVSDQP